jgi:hypothetical protein
VIVRQQAQHDRFARMGRTLGKQDRAVVQHGASLVQRGFGHPFVSFR